MNKSNLNKLIEKLKKINGRKLIFLVGLPYSGKSTLSKDIANILDVKRISFDEIWVKEKVNDKNLTWEKVNKLIDSMITEELKTSRSVVLDTYTDDIGSRAKYENLALLLDAQFILVYLDVKESVLFSRRLESIKSKDRHTISEESLKNEITNFVVPMQCKNLIIY